MQFQRAEDSAISVLITLVNGPARSNPNSNFECSSYRMPAVKRARVL